MDLNNNQIKFGKLMQNEAAASLLMREFPQWADSPLIRMASNMSLAKVLKIASKHVSKEKLEAVLLKLEQL